MEMEATALAISAALEQAEKRTRRERIATAAMNAVIATSALPGPAEERAFVAGAADFAVQFADALIARLDKP